MIGVAGGAAVVCRVARSGPLPQPGERRQHVEERAAATASFRFGAPDLVVVNMTRDKIWVRDGIIPECPSMSPPKVDIAAMGGLVIPAPRGTRPDVQEQSIRAAEIPPDDYDPKGYHPDRIELWPADKPIFNPKDKVPPGLWRHPPPAAR